MADEVASLLVRVTADGSQAIGVLNGIATTVGTLADKNATLLKKVSSVGAFAGTVGMTMVKTFGVATAAGLTASAKAAGQLNKELANIGTLSVPTERLAEFKGQIQDIAIATGKETSDISEGTYQVISAFGDAADTMEKVEINAKVAKAGLATTADSIALTSAVTKAYGDTSASAVQHVADLAFKTVELGQTTFPELAQSMQQVTSLSKQLGVSQEELFASYATLTGVTGSAAEVQTQLKAVYNALLKPSENMEKAIHDLGYESGYTMINTLGLAGTLDSLVKATNGSDEALLSLFNNQRALPAILALTGAQADVFTEKLGKMKDASGAATKAFEVQTEGVAKTGFTLEQAKEKMQVAAQRFGESAAPVIGDAADIIDRASSAIANLNEEQRKSIINTGLMTTEAGVGLTVMGKVVTAGAAGAKAFQSIATAIGVIPMPAKLAVAGIVGITAATVAGVKAYEAYQESQLNLLPNMEQGIEKVSTYRSNIEELNALQKESADLRAKMQNGNTSDEEYATAAKRLNEIRDILSEKYHIDMDSSDIDKAINKAKTLQQTMAASEAKQLADDITADSGQYNKNKSKLSEYSAQKKDFDNLSGAATSAKKSLEDLHTQYQLGAIDEKTYHDGAVGIIKDFNRFSTENTQKEFKKLDETFSANNEFMMDSYGSVMSFLSNIENGSGRLSQKLQTDIDKYSASVSDYEQKCKQFADNALTWLSYDSQNGDSNAVEHDINNIATAVKNAGLNMNTYAQQAAVAQNEQNSLNEIWIAGGPALEKAINDYMSAGQKFGMTAQQAQLGGALIKQGFSDIASAAAAEGGLKAVVNSFKELSGQTDITGEQLTQIAKEIGILPENKKINISAKGDISIVDTVEQKVKNLDGKTFAVTVNAEGDTSGADEVDERVKKLDGKKCSVTFTADGTPAIATIDGVEYKLTDYNSETGTATLLAENGKAIGVIDLTTGKISEIPKEHNTNITATDNTAPGVESAKNALATVQDKTVTISVKTVVTGAPEGSAAAKLGGMKGFTLAKGTQNFSGGLAMVNDQPGIADNRELIIDRGRAFIPEGRNVILPLSKGAKVYTAEQTKAIMSGLGIPHYASGKDNSDAFTAAKDDWTHYTKTHAVTTTQELEKWVELSKKFTSNQKDVWDIQEQIFSLQQKITSELNEQSKAYIEDRMYLNDWEEYGDTALDAFGRIKERNKADLDAGKLTWEEYSDNVAEIGKDLYEGQLEQSYRWLEHEERYNDMSAADYMDGLQRMAAYTRDYYEQGLIDKREFIEKSTEIDEKYLDKYKEYTEQLRSEFDKLNELSASYIKEHSYFNDWEEYGDSPLEAYQRVNDRYWQAIQDGLITSEEADEALRDFGNNMLDERISQSYSWLDEQKKYFDMSEAEYTEGLNRIKTYAQQYFNQGLIDRTRLNEVMTEANHKLWDSLSDEYDDMLSQQSKYISDMQQKFSDQVQAMRDSWDVSDRIEDMADVRQQLAIYKNSVTEQGISKYKDLEKQMRQLQRDEELYNIQTSNNAVIKKLQTDYEQLEKQKSSYMKQIISSNVDISAIVADMEKAVSGSNNSILSVLQDILSATKRNLSSGGSSGSSSDGFVGPVQNTTYNDNRTITVGSPSTSIYSQFVDKLNASLKK